MASTAESTHAGKCFVVPRNQRTTTRAQSQSSSSFPARSIFDKFHPKSVKTQAHLHFENKLWHSVKMARPFSEILKQTTSQSIFHHDSSVSSHESYGGHEDVAMTSELQTVKIDQILSIFRNQLPQLHFCSWVWIFLQRTERKSVKRCVSTDNR